MKQVTVYGAKWCGPCKMLKSAFKLNNIAYTPINVEAELKKARDANIRGVPTIIITDECGNETRIIGFNTKVLNRIKKELAA